MSRAKDRLKDFGRRRFPAGVETYEWLRRDMASPAPAWVKRRVLNRYSNAETHWIETGTYKGDTTAFLADRCASVVSIEPNQALWSRARKRFADCSNVSILCGTSEDLLAGLLVETSSPIRIWLDGHFMGNGTFRGASDTPIEHEISTISEYMRPHSDVIVFIDDVRLFGNRKSQYRDYPTPNFLVDWASRLDFEWRVEHDIFIAGIDIWQSAV